MYDWESLFGYMIKLGYTGLVLHGIIYNLLKLVLTNYYGGKLAIVQANKSITESS